MITIRCTHLATASTGSDALASTGSVGLVSNRQSEPRLRIKDDLYLPYLNVQSFQDVGVQALTMQKLQKHNVDIACISKIRMPDTGHSLVKVPGEEACYHLYHSGVVDNAGRHGVAIAFSEAAQVALLPWVLISPRLASVLLKGTTVNLTVIAVEESNDCCFVSR